MDRIEADRRRALADLADAKANSDYETASLSVQAIANLDAERANLATLIASMWPASSRGSPSHYRPKRGRQPWNRMTPDDALELARTSKYSRNLDWNDPHVRAGWVEVAL